MKILQIGMGNVAGGLEAFVMNYYRVLVHMDIQFDFVCMYDKIAYEEEIRKLGGRIYYIPNVKKNYQGYIKELKKILKETKYDAVHVNMLSAANIVPLRVAHTMKVPKIIAHSHSSSCPGLIRKIMDNWNRPKIAKYATDRIACGEMAGRLLFGDKAFQRGQVTLINNAIQAEKFSFSEKDRDSLRKELGWENKTVIGHVGRFDIPKNHDRMLDIFQQIVSEKTDGNRKTSIADKYLRIFSCLPAKYTLSSSPFCTVFSFISLYRPSFGPTRQRFTQKGTGMGK